MERFKRARMYGTRCAFLLAAVTALGLVQDKPAASHEHRAEASRSGIEAALRKEERRTSTEQKTGLQPEGHETLLVAYC